MQGLTASHLEAVRGEERGQMIPSAAEGIEAETVERGEQGGEVTRQADLKEKNTIGLGGGM